MNAGDLVLTTFEIADRAGLPAVPDAWRQVWLELDALVRHGLVERVHIRDRRVMSWRRVTALPGAAPGSGDSGESPATSWGRAAST